LVKKKQLDPSGVAEAVKRKNAKNPNKTAFSHLVFTNAIAASHRHPASASALASPTTPPLPALI